MKKIIIMIILLALWIAMFFVPHARAFAPEKEKKDEIPQELVSDPVKTYAYMTVESNWSKDHWESFNNIITRESRWDCNAKNPLSSAYGLGQLLSGTRKDLGVVKTSDCFLQVDETVLYVLDRYGDPKTAWSFWVKNEWY